MNTRNINIVGRFAISTNLHKKDSTLAYYNKESLLKMYRIATSVFFFIAGLTFATWASRIPDIQIKLQLSDAELGAVLFALPAGLMVSLPLSGWLVSRYGSRKMVIAGALAYPLILLLLAISNSLLHIIGALFLFGIFANLVNIAMNTQAVSVEKLYGRSIMASFHGLWSLAGFSGAIIGIGSIAAGFSPLIHFSIVCLASVILVAVSYKFTLPHDNKQSGSSSLFVKPDRKILLLGVIAFCTMLCEGAMADWSGVYFKKIIQAPVSFIALGYVAFTSTMALGRFLGDWLVMKIGVKRMLQMSGILITVGLLISVSLPHILPATLGFLLVGFGVSSVVPVVYGLAGKSTSMSASTALAAVSSIGFLGFLIGPPVIGFIAQAISLRWSFTLIALLGLGISILSIKLRNEFVVKEEDKVRDHQDIKLVTSAAVATNKPLKGLRKKFVAYPEDVTVVIENEDSEVLEGRTRNGGYVAYPKA